MKHGQACWVGWRHRAYLNLVLKLLPVPEASGAHGGVIQQQHDHLEAKREEPLSRAVSLPSPQPLPCSRDSELFQDPLKAPRIQQPQAAALNCIRKHFSFFKNVFIYLNWGLVTLQHCGSFCHTLT